MHVHTFNWADQEVKHDETKVRCSTCCDWYEKAIAEEIEHLQKQTIELDVIRDYLNKCGVGSSIDIRIAWNGVELSIKEITNEQV